MADDAASPTAALGVFCGSRPGTDDTVHALARDLGEALAAAGVDLVYGGAGVGVMGTLADAVLEAGGRAVGVIPLGLFSQEVPHEGLTERIEVASMHERKKLMYERSDAFCALPGGYGTLEEVFEAATWTQLGLHDRPKPVALLDGGPTHGTGCDGTVGFWSGLEAFLDRAVADGFVKPENRSIVYRVGSVTEAVALAG
ncbi:MAG: TIGR00730 family Rossman fold protein [Actinomycetota bacterium]|nr:TIGR00730 family Rossman fold protein [Actinomycetota bacterium]MEE2958230.1 TIGR00730 family Rossman fold protein [Actinomycetota bacterium]